MNRALMMFLLTLCTSTYAEQGILLCDECQHYCEDQCYRSNGCATSSVTYSSGSVHGTCQYQCVDADDSGDIAGGGAACIDSSPTTTTSTSASKSHSHAKSKPSKNRAVRSKN